MDQNIIILILILIAILVSFYSAYLAIDNSKKIRRLQVDIRNSLGTLNDSLNIHPPKEPLIKKESKTNLNDLNQFPSLEEIENYDENREKEKNLQPLDDSLKKEMDATLEESAQAIEDEMFDEIQEYDNLEKLELERNIEPKENAEGQVVDEEGHVAEEENVVEQQVVEEEEHVAEEETVEEQVVAVEEKVVAEEEHVDEQQEDNSQSTDGKLVVEELNISAQENEVEVDTDLESISVDVKKNELPQLNELTQEILSKMPDKTIKEICRRENIKLRGTKSDRIKKILDLKEFQVNI